jgi:hypothetical protein
MEEYPHIKRVFYKVHGKKIDGAFDVKVSHYFQLIVNNTDDCSEVTIEEKHYILEDARIIYFLFCALPSLAYESDDNCYLERVDGVRVLMDSFLPMIESRWEEIYQIKEDFSNSELVNEQVNQRVKEIFNLLDRELG